MPPVRARAKQIGASTKRLKPILDLVRGKGVGEALDTLSLLTSPLGQARRQGGGICRRQC